MMHAIYAVLDSFSNLFRSHRYSPVKKICSVILFTAGPSLREMKESTKRFYNNVNSKNIEVPRRVGNCNCNYAQRHQGRGEEVIPI